MGCAESSRRSELSTGWSAKGDKSANGSRVGRRGKVNAHVGTPEPARNVPDRYPLICRPDYPRRKVL